MEVVGTVHWSFLQSIKLGCVGVEGAGRGGERIKRNSGDDRMFEEGLLWSTEKGRFY